MRLAQIGTTLTLALILTIAPGCTKKGEEEEVTSPSKKTDGSNQKPVSARVELKAPLDGVIHGRVVLEGDLPAVLEVEKMATHPDHDQCLAGSAAEKIDQKWLISKDKGVANVVVFLRPPQGSYFSIKPEDKARTDKVVVDQPHCAYVPHVSAAFPSYFDGKGQTKTGQTFAIKNSAAMNHNTNWKGDPLKTGNGNRTLKSGEELVVQIVPEPNPIQLSCDIHPWMNARVWAFDHPYFAVTKEDGTFEIKNVPTGVEVGVVAWHEAAGFFHGGKDGTKMILNSGDNKLDLSVKAK